MGVSRKIWICTECFDVYELPADVPPPADRFGNILCPDCQPIPVGPEVRG